MTSNMHQILKSAALIAMLAAATGCAGQAQYFDRSDTITPGVGDAIAHNKAVHIINPRPRRAYDTHIHHSGERISHAMDRYNEGPSGDQSTGASDTNDQNDQLEGTDPTPAE